MSWTDRLQDMFFRSQMYLALAAERLYTGRVYDPSSSSVRANPYPHYRAFQENDPFHRSFLVGGWVLSRYQTIDSVLHDSRFSADDRNWKNWPIQQKMMEKAGRISAEEPFSPSMLRLDPPDHSRLRKLVSKAFTPRSIEAFRPRIEQRVEELLDAVTPSGQMDVIQDLAYPLPVVVIAEMLGIPPQDRQQFKAWSDIIIRELDDFSIDDLRRTGQATRELSAYLSTIMDERRREPRQDLITALIQAEEEGDALETHEVYSTCHLLLIAGHETTTNLIGNGLLALLHNPDQLAMLRDAPQCIPQAIEELLRYDSPVQLTSRFALEDVELDGHRVKKHEQLMLLLGAANRDPDVFHNPDQLDVSRADGRHLSFSQGIHFCLGAALARLEGQIALSAILRRCPNLQLATTALQWRNSTTLRGLEALPVRF